MDFYSNGWTFNRLIAQDTGKFSGDCKIIKMKPRPN